MSEERLILKRRPQHHKHRLVAALALGGLVVAGVWGLQMKMTFTRYAAERQQAQVADALDQAHEQIDQVTQTDTIQTNIESLRTTFANMLRQQQAKDEVLDQVTESMKAQLDAQTAAESAPAPEVAGETTEAN